MPEPVTITLTGTPIAKGRPRFSRKSGHTYTPAKTEKYETVLRYAAQQQMEGRAMFDEPVRMTLLAQVPVPRSWSRKKQAAALRGEIAPGKPDVDNYAKIVGDALNLVVFRDDSQITDLRVSKKYGPPMVVVTVQAASAAEGN